MGKGTSRESGQRKQRRKGVCYWYVCHVSRHATRYSRHSRHLRHHPTHELSTTNVVSWLTPGEKSTSSWKWLVGFSRPSRSCKGREKRGKNSQGCALRSRLNLLAG
jgi:hypothetical protein